MNTDMLENNQPPYQPVPAYPNNNPYMPNQQGYSPPYGSYNRDPYNQGTGYDYPSNNYMGYNPYMPNHDNKYSDRSIVAEVYLQLVVILILACTPFLIYGIKKLFKKVGILTPLVIRFLDIFQFIITKTFSKIAKMVIEKETKTKLSGKNETIEAIETHLTEGLKTQLYVAPNEENKVQDEKRYDPSIYRSTNTDDIERSK